MDTRIEMERVKLTATSIKEFTGSQLQALRITHEHNLEIIRKEVDRRSLIEEEPNRTVIVRLGKGTASKAVRKKIKVKKKETSKKKKKAPTIKDMQEILRSHDIDYTKSWSRDKHWELIKKKNLVRETRKFTEVRYGLH